MITRFLTFAIVSLMSVVVLTSCDEHEYIDDSIHVGNVLCDDHQVMTLESYKAQGKSNAVGVVYATQTDEHPILAVYLDEIKNVQFCDSLGMNQGTSCSLTAYDGFSNTSNLQNNIDPKTLHGSPMAQAVFDFGSFGQSTFIPSLQEMRLLVSSLPVVNPVIAQLGGIPVSTTSNDGACWYWTSTEVAQNPSKQSWLVSAAAGSYQETPKDEPHSVRTIVYLYR